MTSGQKVIRSGQKLYGAGLSGAGSAEQTGKGKPLCVIFSSFVGLISGAIGWVITHFFFAPYSQIRELRREAQEALIINGNLSRQATDEERRPASDAFRRIGAGLVALDAAYPCVSRCVRERWWRWDIHRAGELLIGLGNSVGDSMVGGSMAEPGAVEQVAEIRRCLNLRKPADISPAWQRALTDHGDDTPPGPAGEAR